MEPGALPLTTAWAFEGERVTTPPVITGGDGPAAQRVAYGTADGRVHLRALDSGAEVGPAGGMLIADATVTDPGRALASGFVSSSSERRPGILYVVHDDGGGVAVARIDEKTGERLGDDEAVPGSLGCEEVGAPLLTPQAADGTRVLFFTMRGSCPAGPSLVRFGVLADGSLVTPDSGPVDGLSGADPALVVIGGVFHVTVGRFGGIDFRRADGVLDAAPEAELELDDGETPFAFAADATDLLVLASAGSGSRVRRVTLAGTPTASAATLLTGAPRGLAVGVRVAVSTTDALTVLERDLSLVASAPGSAGPPAIAGGYAYVAGRVVRLTDAAAEPVRDVANVAPAIARGYVSFGAVTLSTADVTPPAIDAHGLVATVGDDRGLAEVMFSAGREMAPGTTLGSVWQPSLWRGTLRLAPGRHRIRVTARDRAGNLARATSTTHVRCGRTVRGTRRADVLRGSDGPDCLAGRSGPDRVHTVGGGADRVRCGRGRDVALADTFDRIADDCERIRRHVP